MFSHSDSGRGRICELRAVEVLVFVARFLILGSRSRFKAMIREEYVLKVQGGSRKTSQIIYIDVRNDTVTGIDIPRRLRTRREWQLFRYFGRDLPLLVNKPEERRRE